MSIGLTNIFAYNTLNFNNLGLLLCVEIVERERERLGKHYISNKNILGGLLRLFLLVCLFDTHFFIPAYFPNKYTYSSVGKRFRVFDLFCCCRFKSTRMTRLPMAQLCPAAMCSDYMLLPFLFDFIQKFKRTKHINNN